MAAKVLWEQQGELALSSRQNHVKRSKYKLERVGHVPYNHIRTSHQWIHVLLEATKCGQSKYSGTDLEETLALSRRREPLLVLEANIGKPKTASSVPSYLYIDFSISLLDVPKWLDSQSTYHAEINIQKILGTK